MGMQRAQYLSAVQEAELWAKKKREREAALRAYYEKQGRMDQVQTDVQVSRDPDVQDAQVLIDRATARATMYGLGAVMDAIDALSTRMMRIPSQR